MKALSFILVLILFLTACHKQQVKHPDAPDKSAPLVIDYPAGVMISPQYKSPLPLNRNYSFAEKILSPHQIPVLDSNSKQMVFVKLNGDRISISMDELAGKYDIILFNAVNNPVPMRMADLQGALNQVFNFKDNAKTNNYSVKLHYGKHVPATDTLIRKSIRSRMISLRNRDKKIIVTSADTSSRKFTARIIRGIQWIEQKVDTRTILKINFENDLITYANTDRYFTNGITIDLQAAWLARSPVQKLMLPYRHNANINYGMSLVQDMYTPTDTRVAPSLKNDRPYASYLYLSFRKTAADPLRKLKLTSQLDAGYIGPYSPGSYLQTLVHKSFPTNDVPLGWETQIKTDVILNYAVNAEKALVSKRNITLLAGLDAKTGTLFNHAGAGFTLQAGKADPVFGLPENEQWPKLEYYFFAKTHVHFVAYNALLQGGIFNHDNVFTLKSNEIQRLVGSAEAGFHFRYRGVGMEVAQHYLSPEYKGGLWHKWGQMSLIFRF